MLVELSGSLQLYGSHQLFGALSRLVRARLASQSAWVCRAQSWWHKASMVRGSGCPPHTAVLVNELVSSFECGG